jgi:hypothetical protein
MIEPPRATVRGGIPPEGVPMKRLLFALLVCFPLPLGAEVLHFNLCTLRPGKTIADARAWQAEWKTLIAKNKIEYALQIAVPHAASQERLDQFYLGGSSPTLTTYAKAWEWWYANADAQALNAKLVETAACDSGAVYIAD